MWNLKSMIQINLFTKQKQTHRLRKPIYGYQRGKVCGGINQEVGINKCMPLFILEKEMATHSSILAWRIPWTEEPGGLQSMESQRAEHN